MENYDTNHNYTIKLTSDRGSELVAYLNDLGQILSDKAHVHYTISPSPLYNDLFFVPMYESDKLGLFNPYYKYIVLNEKILTLDTEIIKNIFIHELAHALDYAINGYNSGHNTCFRTYCNFFGIKKGFDKAAVKSRLLSSENRERRIEKLIALSSSPFENEAAEAIKKARQLISENPELSKTKDNDRRLYYTDILVAKKISSRYLSIANLASELSGAWILIVRGYDNEGNSSIRAYGKLEEIEFFIYLYNQLNQAIKGQIYLLRNIYNKKIYVDDFTVAACKTIRERVIGLDKESDAIILASRNNNGVIATELIEKENGAGIRSLSRRTKQKDANSIISGKAFGNEVNIPKGVERRELE